MEAFSIAAVIFIICALVSAVVILVDTRRRPQPMPVMGVVWPLTALWSGPVGLAAYFAFGRVPAGARPMKMDAMAMPGMKMDGDGAGGGHEAKPEAMGDMKMPDMKTSAASGEASSDAAMPDMPMGDGDRAMPMKMDGGDRAMPMKMDGNGADGGAMGGMKMDDPRPFWQRISLSTFHCGAGCTVADLIGESAGTALLAALALHGIVAQWALDYILALATGAFFQFMAIRPMMRKEPASAVFWKALKIDCLSLTAWQVGMYTVSGILTLAVFPGISHATPAFWFIMQLAMFGGFACSYPMNVFLVKRGIKPAM